MKSHQLLVELSIEGPCLKLMTNPEHIQVVSFIASNRNHKKKNEIA